MAERGGPKRLYQMIALAILIGAPVIANLASSFAPIVQDEAATNAGAPVAQSALQAAPPLPSPPPPTDLPPVSDPQPVDSSLPAVASEAAPLLDPHGIDPVPAVPVQSLAKHTEPQPQPPS